jgi:tripartite ATP-independent transporter DctP family solute receptor
MLCLVIFTLLPMISPADTMGEERISFKFGHCCSTSGPYHMVAEKFKELIASRSNSLLNAQVFPNHQLGNEREMIEGVSSGIIQAAVITNAPFGTFQYKMMHFDLPFVFKDRAQAHEVLDGPLGRDALKSLETIGIKGLAFAEGGFRHIITKHRPISHPNDLKGISFRVMETPVYIATFKALGAKPTPIAWGNAYNALQQDIIEGLEIPIAVIYENQFYKISKHLTLSYHTYSPLVIIANLRWFENLAPQFQTIMQKSAIDSSVFERKMIAKNERLYLEKLKNEGLNIITIENMDPWRQKVKPVYDQFDRILD